MIPHNFFCTAAEAAALIAGLLGALVVVQANDDAAERHPSISTERP